MVVRPIPQRHWRSYGTEPLLTGREALDEPFRAFPSFMRITCDRCGKDRMVNESHASWRGRAVRDILKRMRHDGCGGRPGRVERLTGYRAAPEDDIRDEENTPRDAGVGLPFRV